MPVLKSLSAALLLAALAGCGSGSEIPNIVPVSGKVTLDGKPLAGANLNFYPEVGNIQGAVGTTDAEGRYTLRVGPHEGALPGKYKVAISALVGPDGKPVQPQPGMDVYQLMAQKKARELLPPSYSNLGETKLRKEITAGEPKTDVDFALKADGT